MNHEPPLFKSVEQANAEWSSDRKELALAHSRLAAIEVVATRCEQLSEHTYDHAEAAAYANAAARIRRALGE